MPHSFRTTEGRSSLKVCDLSGRLDALGAALLGQDLDAMLADSEYNLAVNLQDLESVSAGGLHVLLGFAQKARAAKGELRFFGANTNVARVLEIAGFNRYFQFDTTEEETLRAFAD